MLHQSNHLKKEFINYGKIKTELAQEEAGMLNTSQKRTCKKYTIKRQSLALYKFVR